jgi:hypothetical protein
LGQYLPVWLAKQYLLFQTAQSRVILNPRLLIVLVDKAEAEQALE